MGKFKAPPMSLEEFAAGASTRSVEPPKAQQPRIEHDPKATPRTGINLRLNDYELALLREYAAAEDRSIQKVARSILIPELERRLGITPG